MQNLAQWIVFLAVAFATGSSLASDEPAAFGTQQTEPPGFAGPMAPQIQRLPPVEPGEEEFLVEDATQPAEPERGDGLGPTGEQRSPLQLRLQWIPQQGVKGQPADWAVHSEELDISFPLRIDPHGIWLGLASVQHLSIDTDAVLPNSGLPVPERFWDIEFGTMRIQSWDNGWKGGAMLRVGSPSDRPYGAFRDLSMTMLAFLTVPVRERDAWSFSVFYSPTSQIVFPIPGVAYVWRPSEALEAKLGIPFSINYRPTDTFTLTASYMPLNNVQVRLQQELGACWSVYGGYRTLTETFFYSERQSDRERTYLFDQRLTVGLRRELGRGWSVDLSAAYVFDRRFFFAHSFSGERRESLAIEPGVAGMLQLQWTR